MKRVQLRQLILEELNKVSEGFTTNMPDNIPTTAELMAQMKGDDEKDMPQYNDEYDEQYDAPYDTAAEAGSGAPGVNRPLTTGELIALMTADKDPNSDYKLSIERLQSLNYSNLSGEELDIVS